MELKERIRQVVAREHHEHLAANDPILMTVTVNDLILAYHLEKFQNVLDQQLEQMEIKAHEKHNEFLNAELKQTNSAISAMKANFEATEKRMNNVFSSRISELETASQKTLKEIETGMKIVNTLLIAGCLAFGFVAGILAKVYLLH